MDDSERELAERDRWSAEPDRHARVEPAADTRAQAPGHAPGAARPATGGTGLATGALVAGILALAALILTLGGLFFIALPLGILAMVLGTMAKRRADTGRADPRGRGRARAGWVLGLIATVLSTIVLALIIAGIAALGGLDGIQKEVNQQQQQLERSQ